MQQQLLTYQLQFDDDKFMITKRLYLEMFAQMNYLVDYVACRKYARNIMSKSGNEIEEVKAFKTRKIDLEL